MHDLLSGGKQASYYYTLRQGTTVLFYVYAIINNTFYKILIYHVLLEHINFSNKIANNSNLLED